MKKKCLLKECENTIEKGGKGYCGKHYIRLKRYGDVNYITPESVRVENLRNAQPNLGKCKKNTYKKSFGMHEHRRIAQEKLGRKLLPDEHVHHIDGDKHNNNPENLIVMTRAEHAREHSRIRNGRAIQKAKLKNVDVLNIRNSNLPQSKIAEIYNVSQSLICNIKLNKIYKYIK